MNTFLEFFLEEFNIIYNIKLETMVNGDDDGDDKDNDILYIIFGFIIVAILILFLSMSSGSIIRHGGSMTPHGMSDCLQCIKPFALDLVDEFKPLIEYFDKAMKNISELKIDCSWK